MKYKVLVTEDEQMKLITLEDALKKKGYIVKACPDGQSALKEIESNTFDIAIVDMKLPGVSGLDLLKEIKKRSHETEVIIMTAYGTVETAVEAMKLGAHDYILKPFSNDEFIEKLEKIKEYIALQKENILLHQKLDEIYGLDNIIGQNEQMQKVYELVRTVAPIDTIVLISGESGTGKELIAHAIHRYSSRKHNPFVKVSCAVLSGTLLESELFGCEKGAYTGAYTRREGRFKIADSGTIFLDDVDDIEPALQVKLLRFLQDREFERVGGTETIHVNVRVIAATKTDLLIAVREGKFRDDLYYRLNVVPVHLPPLRERKDDIPLLVNHFLNKYRKKSQHKELSISPDAIKLLVQYNWPGNIRELENVIERAVILCKNGNIEPKDFILFPSPYTEKKNIVQLLYPHLENVSLKDIVGTVEKELLQYVLKETQGNKSLAAEMLGIPRTTLTDKLNKYNINKADGTTPTVEISTQNVKEPSK